MKRFFFILMILFFYGITYSQSVVINEIMSSNFSILADEDGDYPDWIELYNPTSEEVSLSSWGCSDDVDEPFKWVFPDISLLPEHYLLIYASGKNRAEYFGEWETVINQGDIWKYKIFDMEPPMYWKFLSYNDENWNEGGSGFGYGDNDDTTIIQPTISLYLRKTFTIVDTANINQIILNVDYDDAFVAYINGIEVARANIGEEGIPPAYDQLAYQTHEAVMYQGGSPEAFVVDKSILQQGENIIAIQVHNYGVNSTDMTLIPFLSFLLKRPPQNPNGCPEILNLPVYYLHTNFKINSQGETIFITDTNGDIVNSVNTGYIPSDISKGRQPDASDNWCYFQEPTPNLSNTTQGFIGIAQNPEFSFDAGFYQSQISLQLSVNSPNANIYYTTNGSTPTMDSALYQEPILIDTTTVIKARSFEEEKLPSDIVTNTYFINDEHDLTVVSISTDPANFFDYYTGIYVLGPNANDYYPYEGANFFQDWEKPINIELFEPNGETGFNVQAGVKIYGGMTRGLPEKSLAIHMRSCYGYNKLNYRFFDDKNIDTFKAFLLRNSGNDWLKTLLRDAMMTGLIADAGVERQAYRPCVVYINGVYWGIHNIREKINEHFLASNCGVNPDNVDILEKDAQVIQGDNQDYIELIEFLHNNDISISENYEYIKSKIDILNFITYEETEIFVNNLDWPYNNIKFWKPRTPNGKWRWIIYDTDYGFGLWNATNYWDNSLEYATDDDSELSTNPPWSTFLLRTLLQNQEFRELFINRFCDLLNTNFKPEKIIQQIDQKSSVIASEIPRHIERWQDTWQNYIGNWDDRIQHLRNYAEHRTPIMKDYIKTFFDLSDRKTINLNIEPINAGKIKINTINISDFPWEGDYFPDVPITITAIPNQGYSFVGWSGIGEQESSITLNLTENMTITANFEENGNNISHIVINEINYHSSDNFDPEDWVELYNNSDSDMDISGWQFKDENDSHTFVIPINTIIPANDYLVLCKNSEDFSQLFPNVTNYIGDFNFGLSGGGELIRLYNCQEVLVDSVEYDDDGDWPTEPDGHGATLELIDPDFDNALPENWAASQGHGTPGEANSMLDVENDIVQLKESLSNYPNPFNPITTIVYSLPKNSDVKISIFNLKGQKVITLVNEKKEIGKYSVTWNGRDKNGKTVSSGIYFYRLVLDGKTKAVKKCVMLK